MRPTKESSPTSKKIILDLFFQNEEINSITIDTEELGKSAYLKHLNALLESKPQSLWQILRDEEYENAIRFEADEHLKK